MNNGHSLVAQEDPDEVNRLTGGTVPTAVGSEPVGANTGKGFWAFDIRKMSINSLLSRMRCIDLILSMIVTLLGMLGFVGNLVSFKLGSVFLSAYCLYHTLYYIVFLSLFGFIQFLQEVNFKFIRNRLIHWYGFMFSFRGRANYYLFLATVCISTYWWGGYLCGALCFVNFLWQYFACLIHPSFRGKGRDIKMSLKDDPTMIYTGGEAEMRRMVNEHPEMSQKVFSMGVNAAKNNPELFQAGAQAAMSGAFSDV